MTTDTAPVAGSAFGDLQQEFQDPKAFAREERIDIFQIAELAVVAAPEDWMERRQINFKAEDFRAAFPDGLPCLLIGFKGISVSFDFAADKIRRIYIPLMDFQGEKMGRRKGRSSQIHVTNEAFTQVFKISPFGRDNQAKLIGRIARWGQHLGDSVMEGQAREWAWDIPREALPVGFVYDGPVRSVQSQGGGTQAEGSVIGTAQLDDSAAIQKVKDILHGRDGMDAAGANQAVLDTPGLPSEWYDAATGGSVLRYAFDKGLITPGQNGTVAALDPVA